MQSSAVAQAAAKLMHSPETIAQLINRISCDRAAELAGALDQLPGFVPDHRRHLCGVVREGLPQLQQRQYALVRQQPVLALQSRIGSLESDSAKLTSEITVLPVNSTQRAAAEEQLSSDHNQLSSLNNQAAVLTAQLTDPSGGSIISDATPPASASSPKASLILPSGVLAGLLIGLITAFIVDRRDRRVRGPRDVTALNVPVLISLPLRRFTPTLAIAAPRTREGRDFAELAHVLTGSREAGRRVILVTNAVAGRGTSYVAANLAVALARSQPGVTLVCADIEGSTIPGMVGLTAGPGLTEVLAGVLPAEEAGEYRAAAPRLRVITPGSAVGSQTDDLQQDAVERMFAELGGDTRYVVVEAPAVPSGPDVYTLAHVADTSVLVVEVPRTRTHQVLDSVQHFERMGVAVAGAVLLPSPKAAGGRAGEAAEPEGNVRASRRRWPVPAKKDGAHELGRGEGTPERAVSDWAPGDEPEAAVSGWSAAEEAPRSLRWN